MADPIALSTYYMAEVLEERPTVTQRLGARIGGRFLPIKGYSDYRIVWEKTREYSPMAGAYAMEELPDTMDELDFETFQSDVMHWGARMTLSPKQIMFLRWAGQTQAVNSGDPYGVGPAADDYRAKDAAKVAKYTRMMNEGMENVLEYLRMGSLLGQIWWPPRLASGAQIAAADVPLSMGKQMLNHSVPFLAANASFGAFQQSASTLAGITGGVAATGVAWNTPATSNMIVDMSVISDLLEERLSLNTGDLLVLMAKRVLAHQATATAVLNWILGTNRDMQFMTTSQIREFIQTQFEWTIEFYQSKWEYVPQSQFDQTKPTITQVPFMNYGTVLILPRPEINEMGVIATCPAPGPAHNWQDGKYLWMYTDPRPPFKRDMGMGAFYWPLVFESELRFRLDAWA